MMISFVLFVLLAIAGNSLAVLAGNDPSGSLDQLHHELQQKLPASEPGAAIVITQNRHIVFEHYYGLADLPEQKPLDSGDVMGIASMSKQFTGMAVLVLVEQGKLRLEDDISTYFPDLPLRGEAITIRQLLSHTSGLPELTRINSFMGSIDQRHRVSEIIAMAFTGPFTGKPGEKFQYNNTGYTIAVALIEKLSGLSYQQFLEKHFFRPLGMQTSYTCDYDTDAWNAVPRYSSDSTGFHEAITMHFSNLIGGGGIVSNASDMARWSMALLSGDHLPSNYQQLWSYTSLNSGEEIEYGLGMGLNSFEGHIYYYHPGMGSGMNSINMVFPEENTTIQVIRNVSEPAISSKEIALTAAALLFQSTGN